MRQVILDTETTGLEVRDGHRIIEIGCLELVGRRLTEHSFHAYLNPERANDEGALAVHGLRDEFLADKPKFADVVDDLLDVPLRRRAHHPQRAVRRRVPRRASSSAWDASRCCRTARR